VDGVELTLRYASREIKPGEKVQRIWADLLAQSDVDTAQRLKQDPAYRPDSRVLTIQMDRDGTKGFSVTVDRLLQSRVFWVPSLDAYVAAGQGALSFAEHQTQLATYKANASSIRCSAAGRHEQFTSRGRTWAVPPTSTDPAGSGHIVSLTWDSISWVRHRPRGGGLE
jgi:hypothetical protein